MPTIYTDGVSMKVNEYQAQCLLAGFLVVPHPGVGEDGIKEGDLKLGEGTTWAMIGRTLSYIDPNGTPS